MEDTMDTDGGEPYVDPETQFADFMVKGVAARFPPLNTPRGLYALSILIKRWPISVLFKHQAVVGAERSLDNLVEFLAPHLYGKVHAHYVSTVEMLVAKQLIERLESHVKEVEEAIIQNRVDPDQVKNAINTLVTVARETKGMIDGKTGFSISNEYKESLTNEIKRIFRTYIMVFGLESISL